MLKQTFAIATLGTMFAGRLVSAVEAAPQDFVGTWVNLSSNTSGIIRLVVTQAGGNITPSGFWQVPSDGLRLGADNVQPLTLMES